MLAVSSLGNCWLESEGRIGGDEIDVKDGSANEESERDHRLDKSELSSKRSRTCTYRYMTVGASPSASV